MTKVSASVKRHGAYRQCETGKKGRTRTRLRTGLISKKNCGRVHPGAGGQTRCIEESERSNQNLLCYLYSVPLQVRRDWVSNNETLVILFGLRTCVDFVGRNDQRGSLEVGILRVHDDSTSSRPSTYSTLTKKLSNDYLISRSDHSMKSCQSDRNENSCFSVLFLFGVIP